MSEKIDFVAGIVVNITITCDEQSWATDSLAFGACLQDLKKEGWWLKKLARFPGEGGEAILERRWFLAGPRNTGETQAMAALTEEENKG